MIVSPLLFICFSMICQQGTGKLAGTEIEWDTSVVHVMPSCFMMV